MAGKIPQSFIDDLLDRVDIVDIVGSRIDLRKSGKNHSARCPFHDEKTPSFTVSQEKQFYYCFGCGAGGNAIGFVMDYDSTAFPEAVEILARHAGLEVPREAGHNDAATEHRKGLYALAEKADRYYRTCLRQHPDAKTAVDYLKSRGLSGEVARTFGIGFAPPGWDNLLQTLGQSDLAIQQLKDTGLLIDRQEEGKLYDRFRNRIMFPIRDLRGRTIGFGGRVLGDDKPKYLNSPETPLFHKGRELYGLYEANQQMREAPSLLVVEGYMDVVALSQSGIHNAVATLGTAVTADHLEKLFRHTSAVVFCFDGDAAGRNAAHRALETALPVMVDGRSARFLFLPEGEDPDTLVREIGKEKFLSLIESATPLSQYLFESLSEGLDLSSMDGRARLSKLAAPLINRIPQGVFKALMLKTLSEKTGLDTETLSSLITPETPSPDRENSPEYPEDKGYEDYPDYLDRTPPGDIDFPQPHSRAQAAVSKRVKMSPSYTMIALLANHPELIAHCASLETLQKLDEEGVEILLPLVELLLENPSYSLNHILGYWRGVHSASQAESLAKIAATDLLRPVANSERDNKQEFIDSQDRLLRKTLAQLAPAELFRHLADKQAVDEHDLKHLNNAWLKLSGEQRTEETKELFNQILGKPRVQ
ncbi:MAG: DNA primase [Gammaproteobacteria bacterium]|nr:MAG: DNA primase [Gammaproteobacteria bacterium]